MLDPKKIAEQIVQREPWIDRNEYGENFYNFQSLQALIEHAIVAAIAGKEAEVTSLKSALEKIGNFRGKPMADAYVNLEVCSAIAREALRESLK